MCRYAMTAYKPHFACFRCRKTFKRRLMYDINRDDKRTTEAKCPQCGNLMANMGKDFEAPKQQDIKAWTHLQTLYAVGIAFHSCGCSGPGYIPHSKEKLIAYFEETIASYNSQLAFWRQRTEPANEQELQRENSKHWDKISKVPFEQRPKKGAISNEDAKNYWIGKIREVELKLRSLQ